MNISNRKLINIFLKGRRHDVFWMIIFLLIKHSPAWIMPVVVGRLIDLHLVASNVRVYWLLIYGGILVIFVIQNIFTHPIFIKFQSKIARSISWELRLKLCRRLQQLSLLFHNKTRTGRLNSKIIRDVDLIESFPVMLTEPLILSIATLLITFVIVLIRAPIGLPLFVILIPLSILLRRKYSSKIREGAKSFRVSFEDMGASLSDMMTMIPITRAHGLEERELEKISKKITDVFKRGIDYDMISAAYVSRGWASFTVCQTIFIVGAVYLSFRSLITIGDIVMLNAFFGNITGAVLSLMNTLPLLARTRESLESVYEVLDYPDIEQNEGKTKIEEVHGRFEFMNVSYYYPGSNEPAVSDITLNIKPRQSVGIVGSSGSGKTTLLFLILGFILPTKGEIYLDGHNINEIDLRTFRNHVSVVTQDIGFFSGTIKDNIAYGEQGVKDEDIIESLKLGNAWEFIKELPNGINTYFGEEGINLSGGQKQRIAIARALIRKPSVLILDEATSAVDLISEKIIQNAIEQIMKSQTTFIVSHRISIVRNVDFIIVMDKGRIVATGSHDELMKFDNPYFQFYKRLSG